MTLFLVCLLSCFFLCHALPVPKQFLCLKFLLLFSVLSMFSFLFSSSLIVLLEITGLDAILA